MLVNKEIDVSAIGLLMMPERRIAVDLCYPTFSEEKTLMMAVSSKNKLNVWVFMEILPLPGRKFSHGIIVPFGLEQCREPLNCALVLISVVP